MSLTSDIYTYGHTLSLPDALPILYTATDVTAALSQRADLPPRARYVVKQGHLVDAHSVRFYAPDSEQAGLLARQQEIEHLGREIKAAQLLVDQATAQGARAEAAWQRVSGVMAPARGRVGDLTRHLHDEIGRAHV